MASYKQNFLFWIIMKIALVQPDVSFGCYEANCENIYKNIEIARKRHCEIVFSPAGSIQGACQLPPVQHKKRLEAVIYKLAQSMENDISLISGSPFDLTQAVLLDKGMVIHLPDAMNFKNRRLVFSEQNFTLSGILPVWKVLLAPEPWKPGFKENMYAHLSALAKTGKSWVIQCNLTGGYEGLVYSGQSMIFDPAGDLVKAGSFFSPDLIVFDTDNYDPVELVPEDPMEALWMALVTGTRDFILKTGNGRALLGLSGGIDSALVACIAQEALGSENVTAVIMPSPYTSTESVRDATLLAVNLGIKTLSAPIACLMENYENLIEPLCEDLPVKQDNPARENLQARIRGNILMAISNATGDLVLNTGNKSEGEMGYCTLYGDMIGALAVLGDLYKTKVYELASWYNQKKGKEIIPQHIIDRAPSAELKPDQKDTDTLPPYPELDACLKWLKNPANISAEPNSGRIDEVATRVEKMKYKRKYLPPALKIGEN